MGNLEPGVGRPVGNEGVVTVNVKRKSCNRTPPVEKVYPNLSGSKMILSLGAVNSTYASVNVAEW